MFLTPLADWSDEAGLRRRNNTPVLSTMCSFCQTQSQIPFFIITDNTMGICALCCLVSILCQAFSPAKSSAITYEPEEGPAGIVFLQVSCGLGWKQWAWGCHSRHPPTLWALQALTEQENRWEKVLGLSGSGLLAKRGSGTSQIGCSLRPGATPGLSLKLELIAPSPYKDNPVPR